VPNLRRQDAIIVNDIGARTRLAKRPKERGGKAIPLQIGDTLEINDHRAVVVGICKVSRTFQSQPVVYTTYSRATVFAPRERKLLSFVLVKARAEEDLKILCERIKTSTGLAAYTSQEFKDVTYNYYMKYTGIPINFGIAVALGFLIGTAIAGQTFYNFTLENLRYFGTLKAMGATNGILLRCLTDRDGGSCRQISRLPRTGGRGFSRQCGFHNHSQRMARKGVVPYGGRWCPLPNDL